MKIDIAAYKGSPNKEKGDLLEKISKELLEAQGYVVTEEIRIAGAELDLLCKHKINNKKIYVECKAHKENIAASVLRQLWGTVDAEEYEEGWLISTSEFTKDAKGFVEKWHEKDTAKSSRLSFYNPENIISSLISANVIKERPSDTVLEELDSIERFGDWVLLVSPLGIFWCVYWLEGGAPAKVALFHAKTGRPVDEDKLLINLKSVDSLIAEYGFMQVNIKKDDVVRNDVAEFPLVVEVQTGDSWNDYRPARPSDFVGRDGLQKDILNFIDVSKNNSSSRIFSITGNSGLGKSSLIAKIRDRSRNKRYKNKIFLFAVDIRGATSASYILASLVRCINEAQKNGFGDLIDITISNPDTPLASKSLVNYVDSLAKKDQTLCLVFDQFEELYSKPELFSVFKMATDLFINVAALKANIVLGFAWKTDSTTQQDHPAYHMWHQLSDHRKEYRLDVFDKSEILKLINRFENESGFRLNVDTKHQIINSCQGYPWLLKKLCMNLLDSSNRLKNADNLVFDLDVGRLFASDIELLSPKEYQCLKLIASKAPADWSEIIEISGVNLINNLIDKRLIVKSGHRLNIYWDIFRDFILTGNVPVVPFNYIPTTDLKTSLKVCENLSKIEYKSSKEIASALGFVEKTVWNIGADLVLMGLAVRDGVSFKLSKRLDEFNISEVGEILRDKFSRHNFKIKLYKSHLNKEIDIDVAKNVLVDMLSSSKFSDKTISIYAKRLLNTLYVLGFLTASNNCYKVEDVGRFNRFANNILSAKRDAYGTGFLVNTSPRRVIDELGKLIDGSSNVSDLNKNIFSVLKRFGFLVKKNNNFELDLHLLNRFDSVDEAVLNYAKKEKLITYCIDLLLKNENLDSDALAVAVAQKAGVNWSESTIKVNGGILFRWSKWIIDKINF